ncbi:hypothetical protein R1T16_05395 [Flavobacterium sp. DG1-102-2]|uniref:hypothetical protein n=1 Tax=Flavobacterium sp. DG1-102-2 TaxID=3081663 RepID=UPI002949428C|nr:hypothetical protein [Flavobacterium sp. DG1-102-2]MDV6167849.1 hypothetical protein [Flavobacterium sp. DG1-102-2]
MKYIIIKGAKSSGKAETISEICQRLKPEAVKRVYFSESGSVAVENYPPAKKNPEGTYIVTVRKKNILIVSGSPTEQKKRITSIVESVFKLNFKPEFAIIAMCGLEKLKDFSTSREMEKFGKCIYETKIWRIPSYNYHMTEEWNKRISYITAITLHNL